MRNLLFLLLTTLIITSITTSCYNNKEKSTAIETEVDVLKETSITANVVVPKVPSELLSRVDTSKIKTFDDYSTVEQILFNEYSALKQEAFENYDEKKYDAFDEYYSLKQKYIMTLREKQNAKYLEWLDAEKMNDYQKQKAIESSPEFADYVSVEKTEYRKYKGVEKSLYTTYQQVEKSAYREYKTKKALAYQVYKKNQ